MGPGISIGSQVPLGDRQDDERCGSPVSQPFSPLGKYFDISLLFYLKVGWGAGEGNKNQEHQLAPARAFSTARKVEREVKMNSHLIGRKIREERLIRETFITTRVFDSVSLTYTVSSVILALESCVVYKK